MFDLDQQMESEMQIGKYYNHSHQHYRFPRQCPGFNAVPDSPGWVWWLAGGVCALIILALVIS